jgi:hypothetical protein
MQIIAQSQAPTRISYIHLAYIAAQLDNRISKGDLLPAQAFLGIALTTAVACGAIGAKLAGKGASVRAAKIGVVLGFVAGLSLLWIVEAVWSDRRSNQDVVKHVLQTRQFWALRDPWIAAGMEAAASTNGAAAALAATYYSMKGQSGKEKAPELVVKGYRFCEAAAAKGCQSWLVRTNDLLNSSNVEAYRTALEAGKLSPTDAAWAKQKLVEFAQQFQEEEPAGVK